MRVCCVQLFLSCVKFASVSFLILVMQSYYHTSKQLIYVRELKVRKLKINRDVIETLRNFADPFYVLFEMSMQKIIGKFHS